MALPFPFPAPGVSKGLIQIGTWLLEAGLHYAVDYIDQAGDVSAPDSLAWRHVQVGIWDATDTEVANRAYIGFDFAKITGGGWSSDWSSGDLDNLAANLNTYMTALMPGLQTRVAYREARVYRKSFNPLPAPDVTPADDDPYAPTGPPERVIAANIAGSDAQLLPPQCSVTVTEKTSFPQHWGRFYLPFLGGGSVTSKGLVNTTRCDAIGTYTLNFYNDMAADNLIAVVPTVQVNKQTARALNTIAAIQVDNVWDVVRRRRTRSATHRFSTAP